MIVIMSSVRGVVVVIYGILNKWLRLDEPSRNFHLMKHKTLENSPRVRYILFHRAEIRRDAISGSLFSSEVMVRALLFLLSQPLLFTIPHQPVQTFGVMLHRVPISVPVISRSRYSWHHSDLVW